MKKFKSEPDVMDEIGCREMSLRMISAVVMVCVALTLPSCTYNRNAPLFETNIEANGNTTTVPIVGP